ncbi:MAG: 50S ribosomal protein L25/general stress protein Ctc [Cytophagales bacterium]
MKSLEVIGFKRANLGKVDSKTVREQALVPAVLYGGDQQHHINIPAFLFRDLVYTKEVSVVKLNIEGKIFDCVLQDVQFHPVNDMILHADFLQLFPDKQVKMNIPIRFVGNAIGIQKGGKFASKIQKLKVMALPKDLPDFIDVEITNLDLGKSVRVRDIKPAAYKILNPPELPLASILIPRSLKSQQQDQGGKKK